jgi:uncharacterized lipoprotein YddW (UPF0748 family)
LVHSLNFDHEKRLINITSVVPPHLAYSSLMNGTIMRKSLLLPFLLLAHTAFASPVQTVALQDFEAGAPGVAAVTSSNSSAAGASGSQFSVVAEGGSQRLRMTDPDGSRNGILIHLPGAILEPGYFLITADIKVNNSSTAIRTFGMAAKVGAPGTARVLDPNAGYVLNLADHPTNAAALGYQTIGAAIQVAAGGTFPQDLTLYFSTDPSGSPNDSHGDFTGSHRGTAASWATSGNTSAVYIDNIKRIGPGNFGEERHAWISVSDSMTNLTALENHIQNAFTNGFNCIDILVRYRANHYYTPNRDIFTSPNNEPYVAGSSATNDPIQFAIDRAHALGMRVYGSFSTFLSTDGHNNYPSYLPPNSRTYVYNGPGVQPVLQTTAHDAEGIWTDAGLSSVHTYIRNLVVDLITNYDLDGIIFDRIRYQGRDFGYNPTAMAEMGFNFNNPPAPNDPAWIAARQQRLAEFLSGVYSAVTDVKPWVIVGTVPVAYLDRLGDTYNHVMQSWPTWSEQTPGNRTVTFGAHDLIQPQFYRQWDSASPYSAPAANRRLMERAVYGDTTADPMDYGLMPGAITNVAPLFATLGISGAADAQNTANAIAANICDTQIPPTAGAASYFMNGSGVYSARGLFTDATGLPQNMIGLIRAASPAPCGPDVMSPSAPLSDFLMKEGWDNTPPLAVTGVTVSANGYYATVSWNPPAPAEDGESASRYLIYYSTQADVKPYYENQSAPGSTITGTSHMVGPFTNAGSYYFRIVPVDDYNNKGPSTVVGPVTVAGSTVIIESRQPNGAVSPPSVYTESIGMADTSSKSTAPGLTALPPTSGARYSTNVGMVATFRPNLPLAGSYNVYVTMGAGSNNNATAKYTITGSGPAVTGNVELRNSNAALVNKWYLLASNVNFDAGTGGTVAFQNLTGNAGVGSRFVMDAVKFELTSSAVNDWQLY